MAMLRGLEVTKQDRTDAQVWSWKLRGQRWDFKLTPERALYRNGVLVMATLAHLCCADDAVLYSLGYEVGYMHGREVTPSQT